MATTDVEKLVVQVSADLKSFENAMAKATGITRGQLAQIKADATQAGTAGAAAFTGASRGVQLFGAQAQKTGQNINSLRGQTANLGAQFQDIAVQLQGGTSPLTIALQQGTQISAVLGGAGAGGAVKALGAAFASIVSPVSLVTIGLIAAGGAAVQYFAGLLSDGDSSAESLKKQSELIQRVVADWKDAPPPVAAYAAELERAATAAERLEAAQVTQERIAQNLNAQFSALAKEFRNTISVFGDVNLAFADLQRKIEAGTATTDDFQRVIDLFNSHVTEATPITRAFNDAMTDMQTKAAGAALQIDAVASSIELAKNNMLAFNAAEKQSRAALATVEGVGTNVLGEMERRNKLTAEQLELEDEIADVRGRVIQSGGTAAASEIEAAARANIATEKARAAAAKAASEAAKSSGGGGGASKAATEAEREREAVVKLIEALQYEQSLIGLSALEKEKMNALRKAGAAATSEERAQIEAIVTASYAQTEALKASEEQLERLRGLSKQVLGGMFEDLRDGADAAEVFANALNRIGESLVTAGIDQAIEAMSKGAGTGGGGFGAILGKIFHQGGIVGEAGPSRAVSPAIFAGAPRYHNGGVAGLRPGEVPAILQKGERVIPRGEGGGSGAVAVRVFVDQDGNWQAAVARTAGSVSAQVVKRMAPGVVANASKRAG